MYVGYTGYIYNIAWRRMLACNVTYTEYIDIIAAYIEYVDIFAPCYC